MRASLNGLTISHLCLSALPRATKELPTTAQPALRRIARASLVGRGFNGPRGFSWIFATQIVPRYSTARVRSWRFRYSRCWSTGYRGWAMGDHTERMADIDGGGAFRRRRQLMEDPRAS